MAQISDPITITKADGTVVDVTVRNATAGEMRGVSLAEVGQYQTEALIKVLPRVTHPYLSESDLAGLYFMDLVSLGQALVGFSKTPQRKAGSAAVPAVETPEESPAT